MTAVRTAAGRVAALLDADAELASRLSGAGLAQSPSGFRTRQFSGALGAFAVGAVALSLAGAGPVLAMGGALAAAGATCGAFEHRLRAQGTSRRSHITEELPIVAEQIGMLLASGMSLTGALRAAAQRGEGICAAELGRVTARVSSGVSVEVALSEWADAAGSAEVRRFVGVLTLYSDATDIAALVSDEARSARMEAHRRLIERIERRNEQVWIPVTVAALVPGAVLLAIPFSDALRGYAAL